MTDEERALLEYASDIVDAFAGMMSDRIQKDTGCLYMTDGFLSLDSASGALHKLLGRGPVLLVSNRDTRGMLADAMQGLHMAGDNCAEGSEAEEAARSLESCLFAALNMLCDADDPKPAMDRVMSAAAYGLEIVSGLEAAGAETLAAMQLNRSGIMLWDRLPQIRAALERLLPSAAPDAITERSVADERA